MKETIRMIKLFLWRIGELLAVLSRKEAAEDLATRDALRKYLRKKGLRR